MSRSIHYGIAALATLVLLGACGRDAASPTIVGPNNDSFIIPKPLGPPINRYLPGVAPDAGSNSGGFSSNKNEPTPTATPSPTPGKCPSDAATSGQLLDNCFADPSKTGVPTAKCNDGTLSCALNAPGDCSSHLGIQCIIQ